MPQPTASDLFTHDSWKTFPKASTPFLALPLKIHLHIFSSLNPIDGTCLSLACSCIYALAPSFPCHCPSNSTPRSLPLTTGASSSAHPVPQKKGCKHCLPVLFYPAHCELHFHIWAEVSGNLTFCGGTCGRFTRSVQDRGSVVGGLGRGRWRDAVGEGEKEGKGEDVGQDGHARLHRHLYSHQLPPALALVAQQPRRPHSSTSPRSSSSNPRPQLSRSLLGPSTATGRYAARVGSTMDVVTNVVV
ncbi:hypothetical protein BJ875DRAFT_89411 [Amylocarpus encephaloides]|uniref:F-box domain-containing protein n=1 Tax=Amylocarpus encephaloides TaxID=45428 RepID=A0A9P7YEP5_9HELO|nr:hypothetical protein BJ875DRAFT_89411 [Amylocarpus encephaloides]